MKQSDVNQLIDAFKEVFATKDDLRQATQGLAKQKDLLEVKQQLQDLTDFSTNSVGNLLDWTQEIHDTVVKKKSVRSSSPTPIVSSV